MSQQYYDIWSFVQQILLSNSLYCSVHIVHVYMPLNICYYRSYHYCTAFIMVHLLVALPCSVRTALYATTGAGFPFLGVFPLQVLMGMLFPPPFLSLVVCEHDNPKSDGQIFTKFRQSSHYGPEINSHTHSRFTALFPGPPGWAGARRELLDFMVQEKINRGRHTDHPPECHSIRTIHRTRDKLIKFLLYFKGLC